MSDYEPMSAPPPERPGVQPKGDAPPSIRTSLNLVWAIVAMSVLSAVVTFIFFDDVLATAMEAQPAGADESTVRASLTVGPLIGVVVFGALWIVLGIFLRKGANWARIVLTILAGVGVVSGLFNLVTPQHPGVLVVGIITWVLEAALLWFLWQKDSSAYLKPPRPAY
ncbi:MAG TPA: hypothetical protein VNP20_06710 [Nocardioidaceae bacterium]|nr:hypothetical protein [Nocardioidaceae bacterium]